MFRVIQQMPDGMEKEMMECEYEIMRMEVKKCIKEERSEWVKSTAETTVNMSLNPKAAWSQYQKLGNWKGMADSSGPSLGDSE